MAEEHDNKKILLVDDDKDILNAMCLAMEGLGVEILTAGDGHEATDLADEAEPDLVVLDVMLPKRSGFLVLEKLKRGKERTDPPRIIMITGNPGQRHKAYAEGLGVDLYLNKPFRMEKLVESVKELLDAGR